MSEAQVTEASAGLSRKCTLTDGLVSDRDGCSIPYGSGLHMLDRTRSSVSTPGLHYTVSRLDLKFMKNGAHGGAGNHRLAA
jgi:hypothetical protein